MKIWQIACGSRGRDYSSLFLAHDLMFLGPGDAGAFDEGLYSRAVVAGAVSQHQLNEIRRFCNEVEAGDRVLLRKGHRVLAAGIIPAEGYAWNGAFDDVHGWDLQHTRRVVWQERLEARLEERQQRALLFASRKQIPTFTQVRDEAILSQVNDVLEQCELRALKQLPDSPSEPMHAEVVGQELFARGLSNATTDMVVAALRRQQRLLRWYAVHGESCGRPTEHEVVAHMILPLLLALGWSEQLLAVEWNGVDLAGFSATPTQRDTCSLVCEAKGLRHGMQSAWDQAIRYVEDLHLMTCKRILLTQGARFYLYAYDKDSWPEKPTSYLNVEKVRTRNADGTNAIDAIMRLRP